MLKDAFSLLTTQSLVSVGASLVPIPGAMGLTDLMMLSGFSAVMDSHDAAGLELLSRAISFYFPVMICFFVTLGALLFKRKKTKQELPQQL